MTSDADDLLEASLFALNMEKEGRPTSDAQAYFYEATGFRGTPDEYQAVARTIVQGTRITKLGNMGALLPEHLSLENLFLRVMLKLLVHRI